ncbi:PhzF family phenazine biosynthesis protein [Streptomyces sp. NPDC003077]|uniref:PhzF family phenazine biosynthesis protein n=1 Tax=Streptomyces sp. NPDC003077 TaxID=3154443 RepID=UPI0033A6EB01
MTHTPATATTQVHVLAVFRGPDGGGGNLLGVVRDGAALPDRAARQALAADLGFSETVFLDGSPDGGRTVRADIYTPGTRLPFAGHPLVGAAWLLRHLGSPVEALRPSAGDVPVTYDRDGDENENGDENGGRDADGDVVWVRGRAEWAAGRRTERYDSVAAVDALPAPPEGTGWLYAWAWRDEPAGVVRARGFPRRPDGVVAEDEATGAAALVLTHELGRPLDIRQGTGSQIRTRPAADGTIEVGGRVTLEEIRCC